MSTITTNGHLLDAVKEMSAREFDEFMEKAISARRPKRAATLSPRETKLMARINRGLPADLSSRYAQLAARRKKACLTQEEHRELLQLTHQAESRDADRAVALLELSKLRRVPLRLLMKQMGIGTPARHG
jgi:FixJ family two-component response regulator